MDCGSGTCSEVPWLCALQKVRHSYSLLWGSKASSLCVPLPALGRFLLQLQGCLGNRGNRWEQAGRVWQQQGRVLQVSERQLQSSWALSGGPEPRPAGWFARDAEFSFKGERESSPSLLMWTILKVFIEFVTIFLLLYGFFFLVRRHGRILAPQPGIEPTPPALEARSINYWTSREVWKRILFVLNLFGVLEGII